MGETQFNFRKVWSLDTPKALFATYVLIERWHDVNVDLYLCLITCEKGFDNVRHTKLISILKRNDTEEQKINLIENLYRN